MVDGIRFVALGDSLTVGFQPHSMFLPGREDFPYTRFLEIILSRELQKKGLDHVEVSFSNAGMLGDTTQGMLERFDAHVAAQEPDYVIVWGGINDLFGLKTPKEVHGTLKRIYDRALEVDIGPIACTLTSVQGFDFLISGIKGLNDLIGAYCGECGLPVADLFSATSNESGRLRETFSSDGVHLSHAGYQRVAYTIYYEAIEPLLDGFEK